MGAGWRTGRRRDWMFAAVSLGPGVMRAALRRIVAAIQQIPPGASPDGRRFEHAWSRPLRWLIIDDLTQGKQ
ncbi:hypothetical protein XavaCFBP5823_11825 [Xanthomonas axonopodis pv. vasculorum]|nr:hypothetical protein XavaCFBP5823_11825 [Xanthomonas axonopodis pv. vasculorum]